MNHSHSHEHNHEIQTDCSKYQDALRKYHTCIEDDDIAAKVKQLIGEKAESNNTPEVKRFLFNSVELTSLNVTDNDTHILKMVEKVNKFDSEYSDLGHVATICVYPNFAGLVHDTLENDEIGIACVSGCFPSAQSFPEVKMAETMMALHDGATEIDMVMSVGKFLDEDYESVCDEIQELKAACKDKKLKVILETGALKSASLIKKASVLAMYAGADYIKTSTGKISPAATPEAAYVMCEGIKEYYKETGIQIGFKAAGGLKTPMDAVIYYTIVKEVLGKKWLTNEWFRLGTSSLANKLLSDILGKETLFF